MSRLATLRAAEKLLEIYLETARPLLSWDEIKRLFRAVIADRLTMQIQAQEITKAALARQLGVSRPTLDALLESGEEKPSDTAPTSNFPAMVFLLLQRSGERGMTHEQLRAAYYKHLFELCDDQEFPDSTHPQEGKFLEALSQLVSEGRARVSEGQFWAIGARRDIIPERETIANLQTKLVSFSSIALGIVSNIKRGRSSDDWIRRRILNVVDDLEFISEMSRDLDATLSAFTDRWEARAEEHAAVHGEDCLTSHVLVLASGNGLTHAPDYR